MSEKGQGQAGTIRDNARTSREKQRKAGSNRDSHYLSRLVPACPCLYPSVSPCLCLSLSVLVYPCLSLYVSTYFYIFLLQMKIIVFLSMNKVTLISLVKATDHMHANLVLNPSFFFTFDLAFSRTLSFIPNSSR